jgi:hypothetical protein
MFVLDVLEGVIVGLLIGLVTLIAIASAVGVYDDRRGRR